MPSRTDARTETCCARWGGIMEQDLERRMVVKTREGIVERLIGELALPDGRSLLLPGLIDVLLFMHEALKFRGGQGPGEIVALHDVAAHAL